MKQLKRSPYFWVLLFFVVSRFAYFSAGVRFDARPLNSFYQIIDPLLMKTQLRESLLYLHTQPPGFNLLVGSVVHLFPTAYAPVLQGIFLLAGVSLCFTLCRLLLILGVRPWLAAAVTAFFLASPGVVLFENLLIYDYLITALLCASAVLLHRLLQRPGWGIALGWFTTLTALVYVRALFHPLWFLLLAALAGWFLRTRWRLIAATAAVPFLLCLAPYVKNLILFQTFTSSTWMGFNIETITIHQLNPDELERLIAAGTISPLSRTSQLESLDHFKDIITLPPPTGIPVLDQTNDSNGRINYNHPGYLQLHPLYLSDGRAILLHYPRAYLRSVVRAWFTYFLPTSDFPFFDLNRPRLQTFDRWFNILVFGQFGDASDRKGLRAMEAQGSSLRLPLYTGTYLLVGLPLLFCWATWRLWGQLRRGQWRHPSATTILWGYMLFHIVMLTAAVNLLSSFENNRYRLSLDPFFVALAGYAINAVLPRSSQTSPKSE